MELPAMANTAALPLNRPFLPRPAFLHRVAPSFPSPSRRKLVLPLRSHVRCKAARAEAQELPRTAGQKLVHKDGASANNHVLPYHANSSLSIKSWGEIYGTGELTDRKSKQYWSSSRSYPYPVGFVSTKAYKGRVYRQSIEEGSEGPVFVVEELSTDSSYGGGGNAVFYGDTPQKVWNKVVEIYGGHQVQGGRHFGFQNPEVLRVLLDMVKEKSKEKKAEGDVGVDVAGDDANDVNNADADAVDGVHNVDDDDADDDDYVNGFDSNHGIRLGAHTSDNVVNDTYLYKESDEDDENIGANDTRVEEEDDDNSEDEEVINEEEEEEEEEEEYTIDEEDVIAEHEEEIQDDDDDDEDGQVHNVLVNDAAVEDIEEQQVGRGNNGKDIQSERGNYGVGENFSFSNAFLTHEQPKSFVNGSRPPSFNGRALFLNKYKDSNLNRSRKLDMVEDPQREAIGTGNPRLRTLGAMQKRIWRKGEGISNINQQGIGRFVNNQTSSYDGFQSRLSTYNGAFTKRREESSKSSQMLLELLQKWNNAKKWNSEEGDGLQGKGDTKWYQAEKNQSMQAIAAGDERASKRPSLFGVARETSNLSGRNFQGQHTVEGRESVLIELEQSGEINESIDYAISRLFAAVGKKNRPTIDLKGSTRITKETEEERRKNDYMDRSKIEVPIGRATSNEIPAGQVDRNRKGIRRTEESSLVSKSASSNAPGSGISEEPKLSGNRMIAGRVSEVEERQIQVRTDPTQVKNGAGQLIPVRKGAKNLQLLEDVKRFVASKKYGEAISALKHAKSSSFDIDEDVYGALMGIKLDPWQKEVFTYVQNGSSVLVSAFGGSGKSVAADVCLCKNVVDERRTLFITPYDHLAREKFSSLQTIFGPSNVGGIWARMRNIHKGEKLIVLTLESLAEIMQGLNGPGTSEYQSFFEGVNLAILDKFHTFSDESYNSLWEQVLMLMDPEISVIALTLPSSNEEQLVSWMCKKREACKLVSHRSEPVPRRYLFCHGCSLDPLLDTKGTELNSIFSESNGGYDNFMTKEEQDSFFWVGYDRPSLKHALSYLEASAMLPALLVFFNVKECNEGMEDGLMTLGEGLLSQKEVAVLEASIDTLAQYFPDLLEQVDAKDLEALRKGFAACHEGKTPIWKSFVLDLFQKDILKLLIVTENTLFHTGAVARTILLPATFKASQNGFCPISCHQALQLFGSAGRRGYDIEGNVVFLKNFYSGPKEMATLVLNNICNLSSTYKPSYSLIANLVAKYRLSQAKAMLESSYNGFLYYATSVKNERMQDLDSQILSCLEVKADMEVKLFQGLTEVNKQKLLDAAMFTRVDVRRSVHSASQVGSTFPAFLIAVVPGQAESLYMVLGADNNFRLLPAGALDHVYAKELPPLDILYKQSTGSVLQPPAVPAKDIWKVGASGYFAAGNSHSKVYVKLLMDYPVKSDVVREGLDLRKEISSLEAKISNLIEEKRSLLLTDDRIEDKDDNKLYISGPREDAYLDSGSETWKEALRLLKILEKTDAFSMVSHDGDGGDDDDSGLQVRLKPLGMLISRLKNVENALWLAVVLTCTSAELLLPAEFAGILAAVIPSEPIADNLCDDSRECLYRMTKPLKDVIMNLEMLRKQVAALQGSFDPPIHLNPAVASMVYSWARAKPGTVGFNMMMTKDGKVAEKLIDVMKLANLVSSACDQVSVDIAEPNEFGKISVVAKRAEELLAKHLSSVDRSL